MAEQGRCGDCEIREAGTQKEGRVLEWEIGLPGADDLVPLSQSLILPRLASAFSLTPIVPSSISDVNHASQKTLSTICHQTPFLSLKPLPFFKHDIQRPHTSVTDTEDQVMAEQRPHISVTDTEDQVMAQHRKTKRPNPPEDDEFETHDGDLVENPIDDPSSLPLKRPRLVWTPQLHKRFVDVVSHLGIKNAVPKTIMNLMNVEGLTRENVASHLQKYRLYLKRMQGLSDDAPSSSVRAFASIPARQGGHEYSGPAPVPMPCGTPMMPLAYPHSHGHHAMPMSNAVAPAHYHGGQPHAYNMFNEPRRDCFANKYGSSIHYPHSTPEN